MLNGDFLILWFLVSLRATGLMMISPVYSARSVPAPMRVMLALFAAFLVAMVQKGPRNMPVDLGSLVVAAVAEIMIGLFMGWAIKLVLHGVEMASHVISSELGFTMGQQIDPMSDSPENAVGQLLMSFGSLCFLISGAHQSVLAAFVHSYDIAPVGALRGNEGSGALLVGATGKIFQAGIQMAAPLVAVNFIISLTFSILGKAAPAVNVFGESFAVRIVVGLTLLGLTLTLASQLLLTALHQAPELMLRIIP
jgi:flagellar biosynthetic protein FliR